MSKFLLKCSVYCMLFGAIHFSRKLNFTLKIALLVPVKICPFFYLFPFFFLKNRNVVYPCNIFIAINKQRLDIVEDFKRNKSVKVFPLSPNGHGNCATHLTRSCCFCYCCYCIGQHSSFFQKVAKLRPFFAKNICQISANLITF